MKRVLSLACVLGLTCLALGGEVRVPETVRVKAGRMAQIIAVSDGPVEYVNVWDTVDVFREYDPDPKNFVYRVLSSEPGRYKIGFYSADGGKPSKASYCVVVVEGVTPVPPPVPPEPPGPGPVPPDPKPAPVIGKGWLICVEETEALAKNRGALFASKPLADYLKAKGWKFRVADRDVKDKDGATPKDLKPYIDRAAGKGYPQLYIVNEAGRVYHEGPLPATAAEILAIAKKAAGE